MALKLPLNFSIDIKGQNTTLVPVVTIGTGLMWDGLLLGTNITPISFRRYQADDIHRTTSPILLNIPSLKESLDLDKRNYKISSVNLEVSNLLYRGERISDIIGDDSLINANCRIFWVSNTANYLVANDDPSSSLFVDDDDAFQVYFGKVRRYEHSDEKVSFVIEDRSQQTFHKDLPTEILNPNDANVPDEYKNVRVPMAFGKVSKSPLVISSKGEEYEDGEYIFRADTQDSPTRIVGHEYGVLPYDDSFLYIYKEDKYCSVLVEMTGGGTVPDISGRYPFISMEQYSLAEDSKSIIVYNKYENSASGTDIQGTNPIAHDKAFVFHVSNIQSKTLFNTSHSIQAPWNSNVGEVVIFMNYPPPATGGYADGWFTLVWDYLHYATEEDPIVWDQMRSVWKFEPPPVSSENEYYSYTQIEGVFGYNMYIVNDEVYFQYTSLKFEYADTADGGDTTILFQESPESYGNEDGNPIPTYDDVIINTNSTKRWRNEAIVTTSITGKVYPSGSGGTFLSPGHWASCHIKPEFENANNHAVHFFLIDGFIGSDFYADVKGRAIEHNHSPTAVDIIKHVMEDILDQPTVNPPHQMWDYWYWNWKYDFTIDKKTNSKRLLETVASASAYIPRFDNLGIFKFDVIPSTAQYITFYNYVNDSDNHTIKADSVIDFSFSKTKIENVYTKVVFKYDWDYAKKEFNESAEASVYTSPYMQDYDPEYYGFKTIDGDVHAESTLVIDDDRGKYIRKASDHTTALDFARWYVMWSCNQHLILKVKLPLSKGLNLEIGDSINFDKTLGGIEPYGIGYSTGFMLNTQALYPIFLITKTTKTMDWVQIECIQMHNLDPDEHVVFGCSNPNACNQDSDANYDDGSCMFTDACEECVPPGDTSCVIGCDGIAGSGLINDYCGVCDGDGIPDGECNCDGGITDYCGLCGGTCVEGQPDSCDEMDDCGICNGNNDCVGCSDPTADNYNPNATIEAECEYGELQVSISSIFINSNPFYSPENDILDIYINNDSFQGGFGSDCEASCAEACAAGGFPCSYCMEDCESTYFSQDDRFYKINELILFTRHDVIQIESARIIIQGVTYDAEITTYDEMQNLVFITTEILEGICDEVCAEACAHSGEACSHCMEDCEEDVGIGFPISDLDENGNGIINYTFNLTTNMGNSYNYNYTQVVNYIYDSSLAGDMNGDGRLDILDVVALSDCVTKSNCKEMRNGFTSDVNRDRSWNILNIISAANYAISGKSNYGK
jgi:hypothetical protein